ncbi:hypothetical protein SAOR_07455 [Salinisphaera orenii MK-B5]|uniref:Glycosyltransferase 2-like domain-containing protein n=1 Tax=Salinisphaera orenii MK-B5 TaxID=856730 RepID=A0A423PQF7_9GAMM|nr:hypothetical protein SAOR_07455 [Salinisphaera orenii MK-B5]
MKPTQRPVISPEPTVAVLIATYNRADYLEQALRSLCNQTRLPDDILVVSDGATDHTGQVVHAFGDHVRLLEQANGGKASALNRGLEEIRCDYVLIFDDDDIALPEALEQHLSFLRAHPECDFTYSPKYVFSGEFSMRVIDSQPVPELPDIPSDEFFIRTMESMHTMLQGMLIPKACLTAVGPFDESLRRSQDHDMILRLAHRYQAGHLKQPTFALRIHAGERGAGADRHDESERALVWARYRRQIFSRLYNELTLGDYLPLQQAGSQLPPLLRRQAVLQRSLIMASNNLYEEALNDFAKWNALRGSRPLTVREGALIARMTQIEDMTLPKPSTFFYRLGGGTGFDRAALTAMVRGLYWTAHREWHAGEMINVARIIQRFSLLIAGLPIGAVQRDPIQRRDHR